MDTDEQLSLAIKLSLENEDEINKPVEKNQKSLVRTEFYNPQNLKKQKNTLPTIIPH